MVQTPTAKVPYVSCAKCALRHDATSWRSLRCVGGTSTNGHGVATHITQTRLCSCGDSITVELPLPPGTTPFQGDCILALFGTGQAAAAEPAQAT